MIPRPFLHALCAALLLAPAAVPQDLNVTKLARLDQHAKYNDIWGYVAPDGREYAILGAGGGTAIINATDPTQPVEVGFISGTACTWRDMKSWDHYVYSVNDCSSGVQVIDMLDPDNPVLLGEFGESTLHHAHNVQIDMTTGKLYAVGTAVGVAIYELAANPVDPPLVGTWNGAGISDHGEPAAGYVHDIYVYNEKAHAGLIWDGLYAILDVSSLPQVSVLSTRVTGSAFTHSTWTTADDQIAVTADEALGLRHLQFWDISDPTQPMIVGSHNEGPHTLPHNPFIQGSTCHVSWYDRGYVALDISDPTDPVVVGRFSTKDDGGQVGGSGVIQGAWGCYPFQPSGVIYVSDIFHGLYILSLDHCAPEPSGAPALCELLPASVEALSNPRETVLLGGVGFTGATSVSVGAAMLGPGEFTVQDDSTLSFPLPLPSSLGPQAVSVTNAQGSSNTLDLQVTQVAAPVLESGPLHVVPGQLLLHAMASASGNTHYLALSFSLAPSVLPGTVSFDIGAGFSDFLFLLPTTANGAGISSFGPLTVPAGAVGLTAYWQFAALDAAGSTPAPVSNVTTIIVDAP